MGYRQLAKSVVTEVAKAKIAGGSGGKPSITYNSEEHSIIIDNGEWGVLSITPAELRRACRCAGCVEEMTGKQLLDPMSYPKISNQYQCHQRAIMPSQWIGRTDIVLFIPIDKSNHWWTKRIYHE